MRNEVDPRIQVKMEENKIIVVPGNQAAVDVFLMMEAKRSVQKGRPVGMSELVAEGLRLERLLIDGRLLARVNGHIRRVIGA